MKKTALLILGLLFSAQLLIPASMILKHERILRDGEIFRFKTRPIDPADPFQGRYVRLGFENDYIPGISTNEPVPEYNERVFVTLGTDADGFCELKSWSREKPASGAFLKLRSRGPRTEWNLEAKTNLCLGLRFDLPFNRFYMDEKKAPRAEKIIRDAAPGLFEPQATNEAANCWADVRVLNGAALIENVYVEGISIRELAAQPAE